MSCASATKIALQGAERGAFAFKDSYLWLVNSMLFNVGIINESLFPFVRIKTCGICCSSLAIFLTCFPCHLHGSS